MRLHLSIVVLSALALLVLLQQSTPSNAVSVDHQHGSATRAVLRRMVAHHRRPRRRRNRRNKKKGGNRKQKRGNRNRRKQNRAQQKKPKPTQQKSSKPKGAPPPPPPGPPPPPPSNVPAPPSVPAPTHKKVTPPSGGGLLAGLQKPRKLKKTGRDTTGSLEGQTSHATTAWDVPKATVGLEYEFGCYDVVVTMEGHKLSAAKFASPPEPLLFSSAQTAEAGLHLVDVTRDMTTGTEGEKSGELEIMNGATIYDDKAKWKEVHDFFNNFFRACNKLFKNAETWMMHGEEKYNAIKIQDVFDEMMKAKTAKPSTDPKRKQFPANAYFIKDASKEGRCVSDPQVNFAARIDKFVEGKASYKRFYQGGTKGKAFDKVMDGIEAFLDGETGLKTKKTDPYMQSAFAMTALISNLIAQKKKNRQTLSTKDVAYKNYVGLLPKVAFADVYRANPDLIAAMTQFAKALKQQGTAIKGRMASLCLTSAEGVTKQMETDCISTLYDIVKEALDYTSAKNKNRYKDTSQTLGNTPFDSFDKTIFSPAPKPLPLGKIGGKPAMVLEQRTQESSLGMQVSTSDGSITWNQNRIEDYGKLGTEGVYGSAPPSPTSLTGKTGGPPAPPPIPPPVPPPPQMPGKLNLKLKTKKKPSSQQKTKKTLGRSTGQRTLKRSQSQPKLKRSTGKRTLKRRKSIS